MTITFTLRGWRAVAAIGAIAALLVAHQLFIRRRLDAQAIEGLKPHLKGRIMSQTFQDLGGKSWDQMTEAEKNLLSTMAVSTRDLEIDASSVSARGFGSRLVVRVDALHQGNRTTHYYRMDYSLLFGWIYRQEVGPLSYWLALW